jgi:hypothetical protein
MLQQQQLSFLFLNRRLEMKPHESKKTCTKQKRKRRGNKR